MKEGVRRIAGQARLAGNLAAGVRLGWNIVTATLFYE
jgi:hypothetical protein